MKENIDTEFLFIFLRIDIFLATITQCTYFFFLLIGINNNPSYKARENQDDHFQNFLDFNDSNMKYAFAHSNW